MFFYHPKSGFVDWYCHAIGAEVDHDVYSMLDLALPKPERSNRSSGLIRNSYFLNKQMIIDNS
jgi:hypothetical protein